MQQQVCLTHTFIISRNNLAGAEICSEDNTVFFSCQWRGGEEVPVWADRSRWYRSWRHWQTSWVTHSKPVSTTSASTATAQLQYWSAQNQGWCPRLFRSLSWGFWTWWFGSCVSAPVPAHVLALRQFISLLAWLYSVDLNKGRMTDVPFSTMFVTV